MSTALNTLAPDNYIDGNFQLWAGGLSAQLAARGLVKTADTGQINFAGGANVSASSSDANAAYAISNAFDANLSNAWRSAALPTVGTPQWILFDAGAGATFTPRSYSIYQGQSANDARDVVLQHADTPAGPWTDLEARTIPPTLGHLPSDTPTAPAKRCYRLLITSVEGGSGYVQIVDFQLWSGAGLTGTRAVPVSIKPTSSNFVQGYEIWRMNDTLQAAAPAFLKIEYGGGAAQQYPGLWLTLGSATDGAGNFTGVATSERRQLRAANSVTTPQKCAFSGANNRFAAALFYNHASWTWLAWERSKNATGADSADGQFLVAGSGYDKFQLWVPTGAFPAATDTDYGCIGPTGASGAKGSSIALYGIRPFAPAENMPMGGAMGYFNADFTAETPVTGVKLFGQSADRTIFPVGNSITSILRGNGNSRLALLWE